MPSWLIVTPPPGVPAGDQWSERILQPTNHRLFFEKIKKMPLSLISFPHMTVQFFSHFQGPGSLVRPNEVIPRQPSGRANGSGVSTSCPDCLAVRRYPTCQRLKAIRPTSCRWKYVWIHGGGSQNGDTPKSSKIGCFQWENQGFGVPIFFRKPSRGCSPLHAALLTGASHWFILTFPAT